MSDRRAARVLREALQDWRRLNFEQKVAAVGALLLIVSTFGPFSFVEAAELLTALGVLALLRQRAQGKAFHLPFGDGTVVLAAGAWAGLLIVIRLFDRPLGQNLLALACAGILALAGAAERAKRPPDDLPAEDSVSPSPSPTPPDEAPTAVVAESPADASRTETAWLPPEDSPRTARRRSPPS
jgi:hypothetical protein